MGMRRVLDAQLSGKRVLVRVDFNVPLTADGQISDDTRMRRAIPLIKFLQKQDAKIILMTHLGRPKKNVPRFRTDKLASHLGTLLNEGVYYTNACIGPRVEREVSQLKPKEILVLQNLRFYPEEEKNNVAFAKGLAKLADVYVNEAFSASHRSHASMVGVPKYAVSYAGPRLETEVDALSGLFNKPKRPFVALLGGVKVKSKIGAIMNLCDRAQYVLIGGAMMFTFLAAQNKDIGASKVELDKIALARSLLKKYGKKIVLPSDAVVSMQGKKCKTVSVTSMPPGWMGLDIPMGMYEDKRFAKGTRALARVIAESKAYTVIGGGDSVDVVTHLKLTKKFDFVSTGGGAALDMMAGKKLPAIVALEKNAKRFTRA
jgi:phosphoglycerate kinase